ncbi:hypothetical protein L6164_025830 [Bauhinia variegata]|uniref:Uncharacterized protein n=1 Tax=Bauhinia variegata TaxID=167791 RepID=A0ACB9M249_BAUVA|nr:hypothetical protein L6164_025830 [Bauhinia variegata]
MNMGSNGLVHILVLVLLTGSIPADFLEPDNEPPKGKEEKPLIEPNQPEHPPSKPPMPKDKGENPPEEALVYPRLRHKLWAKEPLPEHKPYPKHKPTKRMGQLMPYPEHKRRDYQSEEARNMPRTLKP